MIQGTSLWWVFLNAPLTLPHSLNFYSPPWMPPPFSVHHWRPHPGSLNLLPHTLWKTLEALCRSHHLSGEKRKGPVRHWYKGTWEVPIAELDSMSASSSCSWFARSESRGKQGAAGRWGTQRSQQWVRSHSGKPSKSELIINLTLKVKMWKIWSNYWFIMSALSILTKVRKILSLNRES